MVGPVIARTSAATLDIQLLISANLSAKGNMTTAFSPHLLCACSICLPVVHINGDECNHGTALNIRQAPPNQLTQL